MALNKLNKDDKIKILKTLKMFKGYEKQEVKDGEARESWRGKPPIPIMGGASQLNDYAKDLDKEGDLDDEEVLRAFAGLVFSKIKDYPALMRELKEKYFKT